MRRPWTPESFGGISKARKRLLLAAGTFSNCMISYVTVPDPKVLTPEDSDPRKPILFRIASPSRDLYALRMKAPKAFISYSWDDEPHKTWVRMLATRLRKDGIDVTLDYWHVQPGDQLPHFMEKAVRENDFVLIVCTPKYKAKSEGRRGGVGYEGDVIQGEVFAKSNHRKFIPILRQGIWSNAAPSQLFGKSYIDLSDGPGYREQYTSLLKTLHGQLDAAPEIGHQPEFTIRDDRTEQSLDVKGTWKDWKFGLWMLAGIVTASAFLAIFAISPRSITPRTTYLSTVALLATAGAVHALTKRWGSLWRGPANTFRPTGLRPSQFFFVIGVILLLWYPRVRGLFDMTFARKPAGTQEPSVEFKKLP